MPSTPLKTARPLPGWLKVGGSAFAVWHLLAVALLALEARSGPWPAPPPIGVSQQEGPQFARVLFDANFTVPAAGGRREVRPMQEYLRALRMTHNYHFASNEPAQNAVFVEVQLKDDTGTVIKTLKFPDDNANFYVRHRQSVLVRGLAEDQPVQAQGTERIAPKGEMPKLVEYWDSTEPGVLRLVKKFPNQVPQDRPVHRPSDAGKILAESYMRYLCREHGAASASLVRHHRSPVMPVLWFIPGDPPAENFVEIKSYFGEYRREQ